MKASKLYEWLFAEGDHVYDCEMLIDDKYVKDCYYLIQEHKMVIELSDNPSRQWCNEDIPCLFRIIPEYSSESVVKIICSPIMSHSYKETSFKVSEWENDIVVNPFNSAETEKRINPKAYKEKK